MTRTFIFAGASAFVLSMGTFVFPGLAATALPSHPCTPGLNRLISEWRADGFAMPAKPAQALVDSQNGHVMSGPEYYYAVTQIRQATQDCLNGDVPAVQARVAAVETLLNRPS